MKVPTITTINSWSIESVRATCIRFNWYTQGTVEEYNDMLEDVRINKPVAEALWLVANDILEHSDTKLSVTDIMRHLERYAVSTVFNIDKEHCREIP